ncbi:flagellar motor stator protein MotA [Marinobacteraceae bacterium S3BR75-40.1]
MLMIVGALIVIGCILGGFMMVGGEPMALWHVNEVLVICGGAFGAFVISNSMHTIKDVFGSIPKLLTGSPFKKSLYIDLLSLMYDLFDKSRKQGVMAIEADVDNPTESELFSRYPAVLKHEALISFIADYMRIISAGNLAPHEIEGLMDKEIETRQHELSEPAHAVGKVADGLPGFGIVAAILGIVLTMASLGGPAELIGEKVGSALVGTLLGILLAYGFVGPTSQAMEAQVAQEIFAFECTKAAILAMMAGQAPQMSIEFGRKALSFADRPSFQELEEHIRSKK